jgi:hypothetical protein
MFLFKQLFRCGKRIPLSLNSAVKVVELRPVLVERYLGKTLNLRMVVMV